MAAVPRPPAHGRAREALEELGALGALRVAPRARGAGRQWGGRGGAVGFAPRRRGVGGLFILFSLQTISFRLCSLFSSFFEERDRFPRSPPLQHRDPRHATSMCPLEGHQAGQTPAHHLPRRVGRGAVQPPAPQPCHPLHRGGRCWDRCCSPPPSGRAMGGCVGGGGCTAPTPGSLSRLPKGEGAPGGRGAGGPGRCLAPRSPSWVTHSPRCGCEVPRQRLRLFVTESSSTQQRHGDRAPWDPCPPLSHGGAGGGTPSHPMSPTEPGPVPGRGWHCARVQGAIAARRHAAQPVPTLSGC